MRQWYFIVDHQQTGPVPEVELRARLAGGRLEQRTWVWTEGMSAWTMVTTAGLFQAEWIEGNWNRMRARDRDDMRPGWRNGFLIFRLPILLKRIRHDALLQAACPPTFSPAILTTAWAVLMVAGFAAMLVERRHLLEIFGATMFTSSLCLLPVQAAVNRANRARTPRPRETRVPLEYWLSMAWVMVYTASRLME